MNYTDAINYIEKIEVFGSKPGLSRITDLLECLDHPQRKLKVIHVAGTNGKGSTCTMLESILENAGYKVGVYTSPHLVKYNERLSINNSSISDLEFAELAKEVMEKCDSMVKEGKEQPTSFEFITALAFYYFYVNKVDYVILEVGLGGRFDATNVVESPIISIITAIGLDHMDYLGDTIESIAKEKGGIIKNNSPTVLYLQSDTVYNVINGICADKNSKLYYLGKREIGIKHNALDKIIFSIDTDYYSYNNITLKMIGHYQIYNSTTVLLAVQALRECGLEISDNAVLKGLSEAYWPGRMEIVSTQPYVLLDGAHNSDGIQMLTEYIKEHLYQKKITLLIGVLKDKEYGIMLDMLIPLVDKVVITEPISPRALDLESLFDSVKIYNLPTYKEKDIDKALIIAKAITKTDEIIICAGSLYLIGQIKKII